MIEITILPSNYVGWTQQRIYDQLPSNQPFTAADLSPEDCQIWVDDESTISLDTQTAKFDRSKLNKLLIEKTMARLKPKHINLVKLWMASNAVPKNHISIWSIEALVPYMNCPAFTGSGFHMTAPNAWIREGHKAAYIPLPTDPTWNDLWDACDRCIEMTGDKHHVFVEDFSLDADNKIIIAHFGS